MFVSGSGCSTDDELGDDEDLTIDDEDGDDGSNGQSSDGTSEDAVNVTTTTVRTTTTTRPADTTTPTTTSSPAPESTTTSTTTLPDDPPPLDESGIQYHAQNGLHQGVDEQNSRCEGVASSPSEGWWTYVDATNGGDFYALCSRSTVGAPSRVILRDANGDSMVADLEPTTISVPRPTATELAGTAIAAEFADGSRRLVGMIQPVLDDTSIDVVQLHIWLPHDRADGDWTFEMSFDDGPRTATWTIDAPCRSGETAAGIGNPFLFDNGLRSSGYPFGFDPPRVTNEENCRVMPDVTGLTIDEARAEIDSFGAALGSEPEIVDEPGSCGDDGVGGVVVGQFPSVGTALPFGFVDDTVTLTRTASCPPVPDDVIGRPFIDVRPELDQLATEFPDWSWNYYFTGVAAQTCGLEPRTVTGLQEGGPGDYVNPLWLLCEAVYVTGFVFVDDDLDGMRQSDDPPPSDVIDLTVRLLDTNGNGLDSDRPSSLGGRFDLSTQSPGPYRLVVEADPRTDADLTTPAAVDLDVELGDLVSDVHFGFTS